MVDNISPNTTNSSHKSHDHHHQGVLGYPTYGAAPPSSSSAVADDDHLQLQDRLLPIANVGRIMKRVLPENAKISKEAKETMQECVSEFISFVTGEASEKCRREKRKTVNGDDICWALGSLGFDDFCEALKRYLIRYREAEGERANQNKAGGGGGGGGERDHDTVDGGDGAGAVTRGGGASMAPFGFTLMEKRGI